MKAKNTLLSGLVLLCLLLTTPIIGQSVDDMTITKEQAKIELSDETPRSYLLEIGGPDGYYWKQQIDEVTDIIIPNENSKGEKFDDGSYTLQVTPVYSLTDGQRAELIKMRKAGDEAGIAAFRDKNGLPEGIRNFAVNFSILNGNFVSPDAKEAGMKIPSMSSQWEPNHPSLYASITTEAVSYSNYATDNSMMEEDQVFLDDVIVDGSICVGMDCVNGESFGFDTGRFKENNLRLHFDDTSSSASFPSNDWRITINDSGNGGANYFAVEDATAGRQPFRIEAGAPASSLYVDDAGNIGIGTATPVVETHIVDGDSPTIRLEQNGSSGFTAQTWDMAGNETNFFIRDVTNGSLLPFRIKPRAPKNSLFIDADGDIGFGTENPGTNALQIESGDVYMKAGNLGVNVVPTVALDVLGNLKVTGNATMIGSFNWALGGTSTFFNSSFSPFITIDPDNFYLGINEAAPTHLLQLGLDDAVKPGTNTWTIGSDRRLKENIQDFTAGLETLMEIHPVKFNYNGKLGLPTDKEYVGVIAQEVQKVAPYTIGTLNEDAAEGEEKYLSYNGSAMTYVLINSVQEQQAIIDAQQEEIENLKAQLSEVAELKQSLASLTQLVEAKLATAEADIDEAATTGDEKE